MLRPHRRPAPAAGLRRAVAALAAALAAATVLAAPAAPATAAETQISEGRLLWSVKESWRRYIGTGASVGDGATVTGWARDARGDPLHPEGFAFPVASGSFDDATNTTRLRLGGWVHFQSWCGLREPGRCALDTRFSDLRIEIGREAQVLRGDHTGYLRTDPGGELHVEQDVVIARFDVTGASTDFSGGRSRWSAIPTAAGPGFAIYGESTLLDDTAFEYAGPGGVPDLAEHWDTPGAPGLRAGRAWLAAPGSSARVLHPSAQHGVVHAVDLVGAETAAARLVIAARDAETLEPVGTPYERPFPGAQAGDLQTLRTAFDPATDTVYLVTAGDGPDRRSATVRAARWDAGTQSYSVDGVGSLGELPDRGRQVHGLAWNPVRGELAAIADAGADGDGPYARELLHRFVPDGDGWRHAQTLLRLPDDGPWADAVDVASPFAALSIQVEDAVPLAVARDGSYVSAAATGHAVGADGTEHRYPALHVAVAGDGSARVSPIDGTVPRPAFGTHFGFSSLSRAADGSLLLHNSSQSLDAYVRIDVQDGEAATVGGIVTAPRDAFPPYGASGFANALAADRATGLVWATDTFDPDGFRLDALDGDEIVGRYRYDDFPAAGANGAFGRLAVGPDSAVYLPIEDAASGRLGYRRLAYAGTVPEVTAQPQDRSVTLGVGEASEPVAFAVALADPGDAIQWQVKRAGESAFADVPGATGATLHVTATPASDGSAYRAKVANAAGTIVSDVATLAVDVAPAIVSDVADRTVTEGGDALFAVGAQGTPEPSITWQRLLDGAWQPIAAGEGAFVADGATLTVRGATLAQSGTQVRAELSNGVATVHSRVATLTVSARPPRPQGELRDVALEWTGNDEMQRRAPFGGANVFSAGVSDGTEATYRAAAGNARVVQVAASGAETPATWATRDAHVAGGGRQLVRLHGGVATFAPDGTTTVRWTGAFSVNFYGGLVPFTLSDARLTVDAAGAGTLRADLSGYAASQADPSRREPLAPVADVTVATFSGVEVDPRGRVAVAPDFAGVEAILPAGATPQARGRAGWGAWPQPFVDFHVATGLSSYWYTSGSAFDAAKPPHPFVVDFTGAAAPPVEEPPREQPPAETPPAPRPQPRPQPRPGAPPRRARIERLRGAQLVGRGRVAAVAVLRCPRARACAVRAPRRVRVRIAGRRHALTVLAPARIRAGGRATVRVRLPRAAAQRLRGRRATVRLRLTVSAGGARTTRTVAVVLRGRR